ncbi:DUF4126 family protein [Agrobacterium tumefaciens]|nr:DUF4126 family protein [Agrobacterium tumefaciens]
MLILLAMLIGLVAGLRTMTAPAAVSWAAYLGWFDISASLLSFMDSLWAVAIFTVFAIVELIADQLPGTPSRKVPVQFGARVVMGALSGATIGATTGMVVPGLLAGGHRRCLGNLRRCIRPR